MFQEAGISRYTDITDGELQQAIQQIKQDPQPLSTDVYAPSLETSSWQENGATWGATYVWKCLPQSHGIRVPRARVQHICQAMDRAGHVLDLTAA